MSKSGPPGHYTILSYPLAALWLLLAMLPGLASALPNDRDQPIHIAADKAVRDEKQGFTVYSGDVQMNQGSMHIEADKLTIYHVDEDADKIVAEGSPAKMRQRPDLDKGPVHARARIIEYYKNEQKVHLEIDARIEQDGATVAGDSIDYFIAEQLVKADSDQARAGNRVQVVIPPSAQQAVGIPPRDKADSADKPASRQTEAAANAAGQQSTPEAVTAPEATVEPEPSAEAAEDARVATDSE